MNTIEAAKETLLLAREHGLDNVSSDTLDADFEHLNHMVNQMQADPERFSEGKRCRWLGWIQACVYIQSNGDISLDDLKEINRRNS